MRNGESDSLLDRDPHRSVRSWWHPNIMCVLSSFASCVVFVVVLAVLVPELSARLNALTGVDRTVTQSKKGYHPDLDDLSDCDRCKFELVESIPEGLIYNSTVDNLRTHDAWLRLLGLAKRRLELASSYWSLRGADVYPDPSDWQGEDIYARLVNASRSGISIRIAQNLPSPKSPNLDTQELSKLQGVSVKSLNFTALMGGGILHTKLWLVDREHFYVGSANFDWRSLTQVKELGILVTDCPCLASDMAKIFEVYWTLGGQGKTVPERWPEYLRTRFNYRNPMMLSNGDAKPADRIGAFLSSSPPPFCPEGREVDFEAIVSIMDAAEEFIHVAVMDYAPQTMFTRRQQFWPVIEDAIRRAALERGVRVRLLFSDWDHTKADMVSYLRSLVALNGTGRGRVRIEGRLFKVPAFTPEQKKIPYARVNHNKYMVTEKSGYIGTSNWEADYFINTGGIGFAFTPEGAANRGIGSGGGDLRAQLAALFERDWSSAYSHSDF